MSTTIRPEISERNKYWISKHRYYELKHFCLQYPTWKKAYNALNGFAASKNFTDIMAKTNSISDPTEKCVESMIFFSERIEMVEKAAEEAGGPVIGTYILEAVTEGISYECLNARDRIPCCKDVYYDIYRKFFWLLNKLRK